MRSAERDGQCNRIFVLSSKTGSYMSMHPGCSTQPNVDEEYEISAARFRIGVHPPAGIMARGEADQIKPVSRECKTGAFSFISLYSAICILLTLCLSVVQFSNYAYVLSKTN